MKKNKYKERKYKKDANFMMASQVLYERTLTDNFSHGKIMRYKYWAVMSIYTQLTKRRITQDDGLERGVGKEP